MALSLIKKLAANLGRGEPEGARWSAPMALDRGSIHSVCFGMDRHGRGQVLWEKDGRLWTLALGPGQDEALNRVPLGEGHEPKIAVNLDGRGIALWLAQVDFETHVVGLPLDPAATTPAAPRTLFRTFGRFRDVQAGVDRRGSVLVVCCEELDGRWETLAKHFDVRAKAWDHEPTRLGEPVDHPLEPRLAMNRRGMAMVAWQQRTDRADGLVAAHHLPSSREWSDRPVLLAPGLNRDHQAAMDHAGNVMLLWVNHDYGQRPTLMARRYAAGRADWEDPVVLAHAHSFSHVRLALTGQGEALAAWLQSEGTAKSFLHSKAFRGSAWEDVVTRLDGEAGRVTDFSLTLGPRGAAGLLAIAQGLDAYTPLFRGRGRNWRPALPVAAASGQPLHHPLLSLCPVGSVALWRMGSGEDSRLVAALQR